MCVSSSAEEPQQLNVAKEIASTEESCIPPYTNLLRRFFLFFSFFFFLLFIWCGTAEGGLPLRYCFCFVNCRCFPFTLALLDIGFLHNLIHVYLARITNYVKRSNRADVIAPLAGLSL